MTASDRLDLLGAAPDDGVGDGAGDVLDILEHPNRERYGGQRIFVVQREAYVYLVPFVEDEHEVVLKTIIPSRKATTRYLRKEAHDDEA